MRESTSDSGVTGQPPESNSEFVRLTPQWVRHRDGYDVRMLDPETVVYVENQGGVRVPLDGSEVVHDAAERATSLDGQGELTADLAGVTLRIEAGVRAMLDDFASPPPTMVEVPRNDLTMLAQSALAALQRVDPAPGDDGRLSLRSELSELLDDIANDRLPPVGLRRLASTPAGEGAVPLGSPASLALSRLARALEYGFDPDVDDQFVFSYSHAEVEVLERLLTEPELNHDSAVRGNLEEVASSEEFFRSFSSLVGRGVLRVDGSGDLFLCDPHRLIFDTMRNADLSLTIERRTDDLVDASRFHVRGEVAVEELVLEEPMVLLSILDAEEVLPVIVGRLGLVGGDDDVDPTQPIELNRLDLERSIRGEGRGSFGDALAAAGVSSCRLLVGFPAEDGYASIGLAWVDGSEGGLWLVEPVDLEAYERGEEPDRYIVQRVAASALLEGILELLPT